MEENPYESPTSAEAPLQPISIGKRVILATVLAMVVSVVLSLLSSTYLR